MKVISARQMIQEELILKETAQLARLMFWATLLGLTIFCGIMFKFIHPLQFALCFTWLVSLITIR